MFTENASIWYESLMKPWFSPPSYAFGIAWAILYPIIIVSFGLIVYKIIKKKIPKNVLWLLLINIGSNLLFSPIQFGLQNNLLATLDVTIVLISLIFITIKVYKYHKVLGLVQIPYLLWVTFATILQFSITWLNR